MSPKSNRSAAMRCRILRLTSSSTGDDLSGATGSNKLSESWPVPESASASASKSDDGYAAATAATTRWSKLANAWTRAKARMPCAGHIKSACSGSDGNTWASGLVASRLPVTMSALPMSRTRCTSARLRTPRDVMGWAASCRRRPRRAASRPACVARSAGSLPAIGKNPDQVCMAVASTSRPHARQRFAARACAVCTADKTRRAGSGRACSFTSSSVQSSAKSDMATSAASVSGSLTLSRSVPAAVAAAPLWQSVRMRRSVFSSRRVVASAERMSPGRCSTREYASCVGRSVWTNFPVFHHSVSVPSTACTKMVRCPSVSHLRCMRPMAVMADCAARDPAMTASWRGENSRIVPDSISTST